MAQHAYHISKFLGRQHEVAVLLPSTMGVSRHGGEGFSLVPLLSMKHPRLDAWRAARFARKFRPDVIHVCTAGMAYETLLNKYPFVVRVVGNDFLRPWVGPGLPFRRIVNRVTFGAAKQWFQKVETMNRKRIALRQLRQADVIVANSDWTAQRLVEERIHPERIRRVVGGLNSEHFSESHNRAGLRELLGFSPDDFVCLTAGNLIGKKGFDTVMRAIALLKEQGNCRMRYVILGDGPEEPALRAQGKISGIEDQVIYAGRKTQHELARYYQAGDLYVQISRDHLLPNGFWDVETMGRTYFEAGACGIPVIASRVGGVPSVVLHGINGLLINDPEDAHEVAASIRRLMDDSKLRRDLGLAGLRLARDEFSWERVGEQFERALLDAKHLRA